MNPDSTIPGELHSKKKRAIILGNLTIGLFVLFCVLALSALLISTYVDVETQQELLDCTEPSGECYQEGQARSAEIVNQLLADGVNRETTTRRIIILAAVCAEEPEVRAEPNQDRRIALMEKCVEKSLGEETK